MIREIYYFLRFGPRIQKLQQELGPVEFLKTMAREIYVESLAQFGTKLLGDLEGDILEIGTGAGATCSYLPSEG